MKESWKERLPQLGFVLGGIGLYLVLNLSPMPDSPVSADGTIVRNGYGGDGQNYQVSVVAEDESGMEKQELPMEFFVSPQNYSREEAEAVFETIMQGMEQRICGKNPSLMEVTQNLNLLKTVEDSGVRLRWYSLEPDLIDAAGTLKAEVEEATLIPLRVQLTDRKSVV